MAIIAAGRDRSTPLPFTCPSWCVVDHYEHDMPRFAGDRDAIHRSAFTYLRPDASLSGDDGAWELAAQLASSELDGGPTIAVDLGEPLGHYAELTVETADQFIRDLKVFTARIQQMRDQLAAMKEEQS